MKTKSQVNVLVCVRRLAKDETPAAIHPNELKAVSAVLASFAITAVVFAKKTVRDKKPGVQLENVGTTVEQAVRRLVKLA